MFLLKVLGLRGLRGFENLRRPVRRWAPVAERFGGQRVEIRSALYVDDRPEERAFELGKVQNLRVAIRSFDGVEIPAGGVFSFWRQLGPASARRGFVEGRMLQLGCVVPALGGGLCQLSNALYELALRSGCEILERHGHSQRMPGSPERDATVAWNYIDLRFRARTRMRLELKLTATEMVAAFVCDALPQDAHAASFPVLRAPALLRTCATCAEANCSRHQPVPRPSAAATAFLVDALWPEFDRYLQQTRCEDDWLLLPLEGKRWRLPQYGWSTAGYGQVRTQVARTLIRSVRMRRLASQGAARQTELLRTSAAAAVAMAAQLPASVGHVVVDQTLLPTLWRSGALGGRTFDVLLRRLPMGLLQERLDGVAARWPESPTAADFRADPALVETEREALAAAQRILTPHRELVGLFAGRAVELDWFLPGGGYKLQTDGQRPRIFFPGPTTARKGAYLLREAMQGLAVDLVWRGGELEGAGFWGSVGNRRGTPDERGVRGVVQPAFLEDQPRALLQALAAGVPVIASDACGLGPRAGVTQVAMGDVAALRAAVIEMIG